MHTSMRLPNRTRCASAEPYPHTTNMLAGRWLALLLGGVAAAAPGGTKLRSFSTGYPIDHSSQALS